MEFEVFWENSVDEDLSRMRIKGGWLVKHFFCNTDSEASDVPFTSSICFVPDPNHEWKVK